MLFWRKKKSAPGTLVYEIHRQKDIKVTKYTEQMVAELREIGSFNYNSANDFAQKHGIGIRSVIAKVRALELPYTPKEPSVKSTTPKEVVRRKSDIVASIEAAFGAKMPSLEKMTVKDLEMLESKFA